MRHFPGSAQSGQSAIPERQIRMEQAIELPASRSRLVTRLVQGAILGAAVIAALAWVSRRRAEREAAERE